MGVTLSARQDGPCEASRHVTYPSRCSPCCCCFHWVSRPRLAVCSLGRSGRSSCCSLSLPPTRAPSFMLPGSATCGVGLCVTSPRNSVNTGEHVDPIFRRQQRTAACQRHIIGFFFCLFFLNICSEVLHFKLEIKLYKLWSCKENPT